MAVAGVPWKIQVVEYHDGSFVGEILYPHEKGKSVTYSRYKVLPYFNKIGSFSGEHGPGPQRSDNEAAVVRSLLKHIPKSQEYVVERA